MNVEAATQALSSVPIDWIVIGAIALVGALASLRGGARHVSILALALPIALLLFSALQQAYVLAPILLRSSTPVVQAVALVLLSAAMYWAVSKIGVDYAGESGKPLKAALAGVALAIIVIVLWIATPALSGLWHFSSQTSQLFGDSYRFWWLIAAYATLAYIRR